MGLFNRTIRVINCDKCFKPIVLKDMTCDCPYCNKTFYYYLDLNKLFFKKCPKCKNSVHSIYCPYCNEVNVVNKSAPIRDNFIAKPVLRIKFIEVMDKLVVALDDILDDSTELKEYIAKKGLTYLENLFSKIDLTNAKNASEKMKYIYEKKSLEIDLLKQLSSFNYNKAKGTAEHHKANIFRKAVDNFDKLSPVLQAYIISCLVGNKNIPNDMDYDEEIKEVLRKIKEEDLRTARMKNDFDERKFNEKWGDI